MPRVAAGLLVATLLPALPASGQPAVFTEQNPTAAFTSPGAKEVSLEACNGAGCSRVVRTVLVLDPLPRILDLDGVAARVGRGQPVPLGSETDGRPPLVHTWVVNGPSGPFLLDGGDVVWDTSTVNLGTYQAQLEVSNGDGVAQSDPVALEVVRMTFSDVPPSHFAWQHVETLFGHGITTGCGNDQYCPGDAVSRQQMAAFLIRAIEGAGYSPLPCDTAPFADVPCTNFFAPWIRDLAARGITKGCGIDTYCPFDAVTREQMAAFLLRSLEPSGYTPPACLVPVFADVPCSSHFAAWINELAARGITKGCGDGKYCPGQNVTRAEMAIFLVRAFELPLL